MLSLYIAGVFLQFGAASLKSTQRKNKSSNTNDAFWRSVRDTGENQGFGAENLVRTPPQHFLAT